VYNVRYDIPLLFSISTVHVYTGTRSMSSPRTHAPFFVMRPLALVVQKKMLGGRHTAYSVASHHDSHSFISPTLRDYHGLHFALTAFGRR